MGKKFALIGYPLGHTMSPFIQNRLFELAGINANYQVMEIPPSQLEGKMPSLLKLDGFNVTIPHKCAIIPLLQELDKTASLYGSVNTVHCQNGAAKGYNTDSFGFLKALSTAGIDLSGNVAILGAGGAARTFAFESVLSGCSVTLCVRQQDITQARELSAELERLSPQGAVSIKSLDQVPENTDLIINATPVGMYPETNASPILADFLNGVKAVFDAIYNPAETVLLKEARKAGARAVGGMAMLVWQAARAQEIWHGISFKESDIASIIEDANRELAHRFGRDKS